eukprot:129522_1
MHAAPSFYLSIAALIISALCIPCLCYFGNQLYLNWNCKWIAVRRRSIILCIYVILCYWQLFFLYRCIAVVISFSSIYVPYTIDHVLLTSMFLAFTLLISFATLRIYLLYFDHQYNHVLVTKQWQIIMDPSIEQTNWFINNRRTKYGNEDYLVKYILCPLVISWLIIFVATRSSILASYHGHRSKDFLSRIIDFSFAIFSSIVSMCIALIFWKRYPNFRDKLLIRKEIELWLKAFAVFPIMIAVCMIVMVVTHMNTSMIINIIGQMSTVMLAWIMLIYPQRLKKKPNRRCAQKSVPWIQIISTKEGFESFANFLEMEFSIENLLFLTEYIQLKYAMLDYECFEDKIKKQLKLRFDLDLPHDKIPLSVIAKEFREAMDEVDQEVDASDISFRAMHRLFEKYISQLAPLEINISSTSRKRLIKAFVHTHDVTAHLVHNYIDSILPLMEIAAVEVGTLILDSHSRFKQKSVYHELSESMPA